MYITKYKYYIRGLIIVLLFVVNQFVIAQSCDTLELILNEFYDEQEFNNKECINIIIQDLSTQKNNAEDLIYIAEVYHLFNMPPDTFYTYRNKVLLIYDQYPPDQIKNKKTQSALKKHMASKYDNIEDPYMVGLLFYNPKFKSYSFKGDSIIQVNKNDERGILILDAISKCYDHNL